MAVNSLIAWTHNTFNPWIGCMRVSKGCENCYAETLVTGRMGRAGLWGPAKTTKRDRTSPANWNRVRQWNRDAKTKGAAMRVFCASLADIFEDHPDANAVRPDLFQLIKECQYLHFQILTKRSENMGPMLPSDWGDGYPNVWLGTSIEDMKVARRADELRAVPAVVRFISYEPALGPLNDLDIRDIDWIIYGGESGPGFRPHNIQWARDMRAKTEGRTAGRMLLGHERGTAFFFKQSAAPRTEMGITLDGETVRNYPIPLSTLRPRSYGLEERGAVHEAYRARARFDKLDEPGAPFFGADAENTKRAKARAELPLFGDDV